MFSMLTMPKEHLSHFSTVVLHITIVTANLFFHYEDWQRSRSSNSLYKLSWFLRRKETSLQEIEKRDRVKVNRTFCSKIIEESLWSIWVDTKRKICVFSFTIACRIMYFNFQEYNRNYPSRANKWMFQRLDLSRNRPQQQQNAKRGWKIKFNICCEQ